MNTSPLYFDQVPAIGTMVAYRRGCLIELIRIDPYTRKDGVRSSVLTWRAQDGRLATSGLKSKSLTWVKQ